LGSRLVRPRKRKAWKSDRPDPRNRKGNRKPKHRRKDGPGGRSLPEKGTTSKGDGLRA